MTSPKVVVDEKNTPVSEIPVPTSDASRPSIRTAGVGWLTRVFSFSGMCLFLLAAVIFAFSVKQFAEPDIWWHLRDGAYVWQHHSLPSIDTYSFGARGSPLLDHEWLSEIPYFVAYQGMGLPGIFAVYFGLLVLIYAGVYRRSCNAGADCKNATITTLVAVFLGVVSIGPRVLLFGWLCMVGLLLVLDRFRRTDTGLWVLPPLFVLWINLHGSWIFGLVVLAIIIASGLVDGEWGAVIAWRWSPTKLRRLLVASAASVAALFLNPYGYRLVLYPFDFLFRQKNNVQYVEEWQSVDLGSGNGKLALMVVFGLFAAALFSRRRWRLDEVLLTAFALWAGLSHARFMFFVGLIVLPILAPRLNLFLPYNRDLDKPWLNAAIMVSIAGSLIYFFPSTARLQRQVDETFPTAALRFMQQNQLNGRIFNQYVWGGYMEWAAPELQTLVDGRADIFAYNGVLDDHRRATTMQSPLEVMDKYRIDYVLLQPDRPLTYLLESSPGWHSIYKDKVSVILERFSGSARNTQPSTNSH